MNTKEMYDEIAALLGAIGKAFDLSDQQTARELEEGRISLAMSLDESGQRFVRAGRDGRFVRVYDGRVYFEPAAADDDEGCGDEGCGCGRTM